MVLEVKKVLINQKFIILRIHNMENLKIICIKNIFLIGS